MAPKAPRIISSLSSSGTHALLFPDENRRRFMHADKNAWEEAWNKELKGLWDGPSSKYGNSSANFATSVSRLEAEFFSTTTLHTTRPADALQMPSQNPAHVGVYGFFLVMWTYMLIATPGYAYSNLDDFAFLSASSYPLRIARCDAPPLSPSLSAIPMVRNALCLR